MAPNAVEIVLDAFKVIPNASETILHAI